METSSLMFKSSQMFWQSICKEFCLTYVLTSLTFYLAKIPTARRAFYLTYVLTDILDILSGQCPSIWRIFLVLDVVWHSV